MAIAKLGPQIIEIRGKFGGVYFKKNPASQHVQAMPRHVHSGRYGRGSKGISCFTAVSNEYKMLPPPSIIAWIAFAAAMKAAGYKPLNGRQWFIKKNMQCCINGHELTYDPPDFLDPEPFCPKPD